MVRLVLEAYRAVVVAVLVVASVVALGPPAASSEAAAVCGAQIVDVMILLDASGSMGGEIGELRDGLGTLVANVSAQYDATFGLVVFGYGPGGENPILTDGSLNPALVVPLSSDTSALQSRLDTLSGTGGWEPWGDAIYILNHHTAWRPGAHRIAVIATDEPVDVGRRVPGPLSLAGGEDYDGPALYAEIDLAAAQDIVIAAVDSGGGLTTEQLQAAVTATGGVYHHLAHGEVGFADIVEGTIFSLMPRPAQDAEGIGASVHVNAPSNPVATVAATRASHNGNFAGESADEETFAQAATVGGEVFARTLTSAATVGGDGTGGWASAQAEAAGASLLGGVVTAEVVHTEAYATMGAGASTSGYVLGLRIAGVAMPDVFAPASYPIPGVGTLHVLSSTTRAEPQPGGHIDGLRLEVESASVRSTLVVSRASAAAGCTPTPEFFGAWHDNDAGSGGDAGQDAANALPLSPPTLVSGRLGTQGDPADAYRFGLQGPGEAVRVTLKSSERAAFTFGPAPAPADAAAYAASSLTELVLRPVHVDLLDPSGVVRESRVTLLTAPLVFEHNPAIGGEWLLRIGASDGVTNYTLLVETQALPVLDGEGTLGPNDAPAVCGAGPVIASGAHAGALYGADRADAVRFEVDMGDEIVALLKPSENVDGARFQLSLYDDTCALRAAGLWTELLPEGVPRAVQVLSADRDGEWTLIVTRETEAVGNWHLQLAVANPMPALLGPDAGTGADAGGTPGEAIAVGVGAYQGRFSEGDFGDCYAFTAGAGQRVVVSALPSAGQQIRLVLHHPDATTTMSDLPLDAPEALATKSPAGGAYTACVERVAGGGQYLLGVLVTPVAA